MQQSHKKVKEITITVNDVRKSIPFGHSDVFNCALTQAAKRQIKNVYDVSINLITVNVKDGTENIYLDGGYWDNDYEKDLEYLKKNPKVGGNKILHRFKIS